MALVEFPSVSIPGRSPPPWRPPPPLGEPTIIRLRDEHDMSTVEALAAELARAIASTDADLSVDLSEVQFMDASTVRLFLLARQFLVPRQRTLTLRSPATCAQRIIAICQLDELLEPGSRGAAATAKPPPVVLAS